MVAHPFIDIVGAAKKQLFFYQDVRKLIIRVVLNTKTTLRKSDER